YGGMGGRHDRLGLGGGDLGAGTHLLRARRQHRHQQLRQCHRLARRGSAGNEFIGQQIDYSTGNLVPVQKMTLDTLNLPRVDLIKIDIEGMEFEALQGAREMLATSKPILLVESIKSGREALAAFLAERGYHVVDAGINLLAIHQSDQTL